MDWYYEERKQSLVEAEEGYNVFPLESIQQLFQQIKIIISTHLNQTLKLNQLNSTTRTPPTTVLLQSSVTFAAVLINLHPRHATSNRSSSSSPASHNKDSNLHRYLIALFSSVRSPSHQLQISFIG